MAIVTREADQAHRHRHDHDHGHHGPGRRGPRSGVGRLGHHLEHLLRPHSHEPVDKIDVAVESSREGLKALWVSLAVLGATALAQAVVALWSGSMALLGDTLHNATDALTAVPLGVAFTLGRRPPTRRFTYGFGRAEDLSGVVIVAVIAASAVLAGYQALHRLGHPQPIAHLWAVAAAGVVGFLGNEIVARYRIHTGQRIGSAALVADGLHARADGFTSLAVVLSAGGVAAGWRLADPVVGLLITVAIVVVLAPAAREVSRRLMDATDPALLSRAEQALAEVTGVVEVGRVRLRWIGHRLQADGDLVLRPELTLAQAHEVTVAAEQRLVLAIPQLSSAVIHPDPTPAAGREHHVATHR